MLVLSSGMGAFTSATTQKNSKETEPIGRDYSHTILGEYFTMTTCVPCKEVHQALKNIYAAQYHPFYYITYVYNKNNVSKQRKSELVVVASPTTVFDGGYNRETGGGEPVEDRMAEINESILECAARDVKDIDLTLNVEWLGAVNCHPEDGETAVPIETVLNWTNTEMKIDVEVKNNEASEYDGHLHIQITEVESSLWDDKYGLPYTFEFKNYAYNDDTTIDAGDTFSETIYWDGMDYDDRGGDNWEPHIFDYLTQENTMVIASVFNKDNNKYVDETAGFLAGENTDPKTFDVYFGDTNPPPKVISNGSIMKYNPPGDLEWATKYYWKVDVWDDSGNVTEGEVMDFTTRGNSPPYKPREKEPLNETPDISIDTNISWFGGDPESDDVKYDVYFGEFDLQEDPPLVKHNISETEYDPTPLGQTLLFQTKYEWKIVAWDYYGERNESEVWWFKTEKNKPPNPAKDERPPDGAKNVPVDALLYWNGSDPNSGDKLTYDVYFGLYDPPTQQEPYNRTETFFDPYGGDPMQLFEKYYWKIVSWDMEGERSETKVFTFETGVNPPPTDPEITGPSEGTTDVEYDFIFVSDDPDNNTIRYVVEWGDGETNETGYYQHGEEVTLSHSWTEMETYTIRARAYDEYDEPSKEWSEHEIVIPRSRVVNHYNNILNWLLERFPNMFPLLRYILGL
jgi:hypothetical protein